MSLPPIVQAAQAASPSPWVRAWTHLVPAVGRVLDLACGSGRHVRWFTANGHPVTAVDRDAQALAGLNAIARTLVADLETQPWPLPGETFDAVVVTNYLWRPLVPDILASLAPGGVLIWETFANGQQHIGRPSNPDFLLQEGELLQWCASLRTVSYEHGWDPDGGRYVQRIVAVRTAPAQQFEPRYALQPHPTSPTDAVGG